MDLTGMLAILVVCGGPLVTIALVVHMALRYRLQAKELDVRRLEAQARMLTADTPEWLDQNDPEAVAEWRKARAELNRLSAQAAAQRSL